VSFDKSGHPTYVTVWCALSAQGLIGPYFFENSSGVRETVNQTNYQNMIKSYFVPKLKDFTGNKFKDQIFMQDGASPHTAIKSIKLLQTIFKDRIISGKSKDTWPPYSPDINPCDYFLWGYLKDKVFAGHFLNSEI